MASKPKHVKTYVVQHRGKRGYCRVLGSYKVGAKNPKEAEKMVREAIGKHAKVKVYYESSSLYMPYGVVAARY